MAPTIEELEPEAIKFFEGLAETVLGTAFELRDFARSWPSNEDAMAIRRLIDADGDAFDRAIEFAADLTIHSVMQDFAGATSISSDGRLVKVVIINDDDDVDDDICADYGMAYLWFLDSAREKQQHPD